MPSHPNKNYQMRVQEIVKTITFENQMAATIFGILMRAVDHASTKRPVHQTIMAIYLNDFNKFFVGVGYRQLEADKYGLMPISANVHPSRHWPYVLMREIVLGFELDQFKWGHTFGYPSKLRIKRFMTKLLALSNFCRGGAKAHAAITDGALTFARLRLAHRMRVNLDLVAIHEFNKIPIADLDQQLDDLDPVIAEILTVTNYPFDHDTARTILRRHIMANCTEGDAPRPSPHDVLIAGSGTSIENRLLSSMARKHDMRVINIFHGGSYGVQSKPSFNQGEKLMVTDLAVFGQMQNIQGDDDVNFINGRYEKIMPIAASRKIALPKLGDRLMYVPTSLRGTNKRHGPYEDMSDHDYVDIWAMMRAMFGPNLVIKLHPKNNSDLEIDPPIITEIFETCLDQADTFVFDYVSTAFTLAASTDKPIIYLDYGVQNFTEEGIEAIKSRCIYYDMRLQLPLSFNDIVEEAKSMTLNHDYINKFVAAHGQDTVDEAVFSALCASTM